MMSITSSQGVMTVELHRFGAEEAERVHEALLALAPVSALVLDLRRASDVQAAALAWLARELDGLGGMRIELRGVTMHQARLLEYLRRRPLQQEAAAAT